MFCKFGKKLIQDWHWLVGWFQGKNGISFKSMYGESKSVNKEKFEKTMF